MHMVHEFTIVQQLLYLQKRSQLRYLSALDCDCWYSKTIFSDNGGKFIGESFVKMCEQFNIKIKLNQKVHGAKA